MMYSLVEWVDEEKFSVIPLSKIKEPRKDYGEYNEGDMVKASCPGFPGVHNAKLVAIRGSSTEDKKELERLAIENVEKIMSAGKEDNRNASNVKLDHVDKRKRKSNEKGVPVKRTKSIDNKENKEAEKEAKQQKKEEAQKKRETQLKKNEAFLKSLNSFKETVSTDCQIGQENECTTLVDLDDPMGIPRPPMSTPCNQTYTYSQMLNDSINQISTPDNWYQSQFPATTPVHRWPNEQTFNHYRTGFHENTTPYTDACFRPMQNNSQEYSARRQILAVSDKSEDMEYSARRQILAVSDKSEDMVCQECSRLKGELERAAMRIKQLEEELNSNSTVNSTAAKSYKVQADGKPRAGVLPSGVAEANHMVELMPKSSVYLYPKDLKVAAKKGSGCAQARYLLSAFFTNAELIEAGNVTGANEKRGLDKSVIRAIIDYAVVKTNSKVSDINLALRSKVSALVCMAKKNDGRET